MLIIILFLIKILLIFINKQFNKNIKNTKLFIYLWGNSGSGKTHILKACSYKAQQKSQQCEYIDCKKNNLLTLNKTLDWLCIDNIEYLDKKRQVDLFNICNNAKKGQFNLLVSSAFQPNNIPIILPDLKTRLNLATLFNLKKLNDEQIVTILKDKYIKKGIAINDKVYYYLINNEKRDIQFLFIIIDYAINLALQNKKIVSIELIKQVLQDGQTN